MNRRQYLVALGLLAFGIGLRVLPHPANFAPLTAVAIFGGAKLPKRYAVAVAVTAAVVTDFVFGFYNIVPIVWGCYAVMALMSHRLLRAPGMWRGVWVTFMNSSFFFMVTNFAVWAFGGLYAHTAAGLAQCYALAIPFFRNSLLGDFIYTASLFGLSAVVALLARPYARKAAAR